jgi:DNA-binding CsgD family transcriptional regulator
VKIDQENRFSAIGLKPEFAKLYLEKAYFNYDIHMAKTQAEKGYILWDLIELDKESKELYDDCHEYNIHHSFTMYQQGDQLNEYFHFSSKKNNSQINNTYLQNIDFLNQFILYYKDKINTHKELAKSHDYKFFISDQEADFFVKTQMALFDSEDLTEDIQLSRITFNDKNDYLTLREFQCLYWLAQGKTIDQIALILEITIRTVNAHIANIKNKTGCNTLFQLGVLYQRLCASIKGCQF